MALNTLKCHHLTLQGWKRGHPGYERVKVRKFSPLGGNARRLHFVLGNLRLQHLSRTQPQTPTHSETLALPPTTIDHKLELEACTGMGSWESRKTRGNPAGLETNVAGFPRDETILCGIPAGM